MPTADCNPEQKTVLVSTSAGQSMDPPLGYPQESVSLTGQCISAVSGSSLQTKNTTKTVVLKHHLVKTLAPWEDIKGSLNHLPMI